MSYFMDTEPFIEGNFELRTPQKNAYKAIKHSFESNPNEHKIVILPTGAGKTGLIAIAPFRIGDGRVLVITPGTVIREGISEAFDTRSIENFWTKRRVILDDEMLPNVHRYNGFKTTPQKNRSIIQLENADIVIANIQKIVSSTSNKTLSAILPPDFFDMIIIDEAHHSPADSWEEALNYFNAKKIIKVTATPVRADEKPISGKIIYEYELSEAIKDGLVKNILKTDVIDEELKFMLDDQLISKEKALDELDKDGVSKLVAYTEECSKQVVDESYELYKKKNEYGNVRHQIIAVACSISHAEQITELYKGVGLSAAYVSSDRQQESTQVIIDFKKGILDVIVHVGMLGEGFDHPNISIAAIFRPFRSLSAYSQFIGRALRKIPDGTQYDNVAEVVHHKDLYLDKLWDYYTGEEQKAKRRLHIEREYENVERSEVNGAAISSGNVTSEVSEFFAGSGLAQSIEEEIQEKIAKEELELDNIVSKLTAIGADQNMIDAAIKGMRDKKDEEIKRKIEEQREELILEELRFNHNRTIVEAIYVILEETKIDEKGTELPDSTSFNMLKGTETNIGYMKVYFNIQFRNKLKKGIDDWLSYDYRLAEELLPEIVEHLKEKIGGLKK